MSNSSPHPERARWMSLLAKAPMPVLRDAVAGFGELPTYSWLRRPEIGLAMVRARTGGAGAQFNLGEMSITRCALRLDSGEMGVAYVAGRDARHVEWAAPFDALMQTPAADTVRDRVLDPIDAALNARLAETLEQAQAARVDFMTMVRGEDA